MKYRCVECGHPSESLYKIISKESIRISRCENCFKVVDKYVECESVQTCLDAVLHKSSAYRHLIHNSNISFMSKLCLIYLMCDVYANWQELRPTLAEGEPVTECHLLRLLAITLFEWLLYYGAMTLLLVTFDLPNSPVQKWELVVRALILSSFGKLFAVPALIWPNMGGPMCRLLITTFLATSNIVALKAAHITAREGLLPLAVTVSCFLQHQVRNYFLSKSTVLGLSYMLNN